MKKNTNSPIVFVGMSGGVDSSVAAYRLLKQGYNVVGVFIKVWQPDFITCNWEAERLDAMRVAAHLDIPFLTCDAEIEYRDLVAKYFIEEYKAGRTPNPDVMCNKHVKFGAFLRWAQQKGAEFIATGHYVRRLDFNRKPQLHRGLDENKDQSYFLWSLSDEQLKKSLFPVGDTKKEDIRKEAEEANIPTAGKPDSQGVCFLGHIDIGDFLSHYVDLRAGNVLDEEGKIIGKHKGALIYTLGQRQGFYLNNNSSQQSAHYVIAKDLDKNTITVSTKPKNMLPGNILSLHSTVLRDNLNVGERIEFQIRYRQKPQSGLISSIDKQQNKLAIKLEDSLPIPAVGQSCVLYRDTHCLGGGIIE